MGIDQRSAIVRAARSGASVRFFAPAATIKCQGPRVFRSRMSRDLACLFDVNPDIRTWACMPCAFDLDGELHIPDFAVFDADGNVACFDAPDRKAADEAAVRVAAEKAGWRYRRPKEEEIYEGWRLKNVRDLLRYGDHECPLGDRVRLLASLEEAGTLSFAECLQVMLETKPIAGLASLILRELVEIDLDEGLIGPETTVRRIR